MEKPDENQSGLAFRLFGGFEAARNGQPIAGMHKRQGERLMAYLILHATHWVEKKELAFRFWGDRPVLKEDRDQNLRKSLGYLRELLQDDATCLESRVGAVRLRLRPDQADTLLFDVACNQGDTASLLLAQRLAEEPLLAGWNDTWIEPFRERYAKKLQNALSSARTPRLAFPGRGLPPQDFFAPREIHPAGGVVPLNSALYVQRTSDQALEDALRNQEGIVLLKGPRQTGKSSLLARGLDFARSQGWSVYHTDFEQIPPVDLKERDTLYLRLIVSLAEQTGQEFVPERDWRAHYGALGNLERFLREMVLGTTKAPVVWAQDGLDRLFTTDYYTEFFGLLRGIHSKRATQPSIPWGRFTLLLAAATEAHLYIRNLNQSPFNVGTRIDVADFDRVQCNEATARYGLVLSASEQERLYELLGGHPYLLTRALYELKFRGVSVDAFLPTLDQPNGPYHDHLEGLRRFLAADPELRADVCAVQNGRLCTANGFFRLRSAGVVMGTTPESVRPRCTLYARYFAKYLD